MPQIFIKQAHPAAESLNRGPGPGQGAAQAGEKSAETKSASAGRGRALVIEIQGSVSSHSEPYLREAYSKDPGSGGCKRIVLQFRSKYLRERGGHRHFDPAGAGERKGTESRSSWPVLSENFRKVFRYRGG